VRPSEIMVLATGVVIGVAVLVLGVGVVFDHTGGKFWFYWIAPLLALAVGAGLAALAFGYWQKVGRLEAKGRPRSD
jgi:Na+/citrate or Na+/malate symporter